MLERRPRLGRPRLGRPRLGRPRLSRPRLSGLLLAAGLAAFLATPTTYAQDAPAAPPSEVSQPAPPEALASPRAAMSTFLEAFYVDPPALADAASVLELNALPSALREPRGIELAIQLKAVLDRVARIDVNRLSDQPTGAPFSIDVPGGGTIVLRAGPDGGWRFDAETVAAIPELARATRDREVIAGVREGPMTVSAWLRTRVPRGLQSQGLILEHWQWLGLVLIVLLGILVERLTRAILRQLLAKTVERHLGTNDRGAVDRALHPIGLLAAAAFWSRSIYWLDLHGTTFSLFAIATRFVAVCALVWAAYRLIDVLSAFLDRRAEATESRFDDLLAPLVRKSLKVVVAAFGIVFIADNLDVDVSSLLTGVGIGGVAIALASQDLVKNLFGSLMVILDRPFAVGDWVVVGGVEGTVEEVGIRSTRIRTPQSSLTTLPNANLINSSVDNLGARTYRRWRTALGVTYDTPPAKLEAFCEGVRDLIKGHPATRKDSFQVYVNQFSASSIDILVNAYFDVPGWDDELAAKHQLSLDILRLAESQGIEFAFPTQTVHLAGGSTEPPSGSETRSPG